MKRLALIVFLSLVILIWGLGVKLAGASSGRYSEPPIEYLMQGVNKEMAGNWAVAYDIDGDGQWDIAFLHHKIAVTREFEQCQRPHRSGASLYVWSGCGENERPMLYTLDRKYIAVRKPDTGWSFYIKKTWPNGKAPCRRLYSFASGGCN